MDILTTKARKTLVYGEKSPHPECIILMGLPGTGKSYVSGYLHEKYGYTVLSGENITYALFGNTKCKAEQYSQAYEILHILARELLKHGYKIVVDGTNLQYAHRKQTYDAIGPETRVFGIHLIAPDSVSLKRVQQRGEKYDTPTNILSPCSNETFQAFKSNVELPREGEKFHTIVSDEHVFENIEVCLSSYILT